MFKLYRKSQQVQLDWIRNHPFQYVALNVIVFAGFVGYAEYQDRKYMRKLKQDRPI